MTRLLLLCALFFCCGLQADESASWCRNTPLHLAVLDKDVEKVRQLLEQGCDLNARNYRGDTPLQYTLKNKEILQLLVDKGASPNIPCRHGSTPFLSAVQNDVDSETLEYLRDAGANIHAVTDNGMSALTLALFNENKETMEYLLNKGAKLTVRNCVGNTILHTAADVSTKEMVHFLIDKGCDVHWTNFKGQTPLHLAASNNKCENIIALIERGADPLAKNLENKTPLNVAIDTERDEAAALLAPKTVNKETASAHDYFVDNEHMINPRIIQELCNWPSDNEDRVTKIDVEGSEKTNRFYCHVYDCQDPTYAEMESTGESISTFRYSHLGKTSSNIHVLLTKEQIGTPHYHYNILLVNFEDRISLNSVNHMLVPHKRLIINKVGQIHLGKDWKGTVKLEGNTLKFFEGDNSEQPTRWLDIQV